MHKFIFKINEYNNKREIIDEFSEWITASDIIDAKAVMSKAYPSSKNYECDLIKIEDV